MTNISNSLKNSNFISCIFLLLVCVGAVQCLIWTIDHKSFDGCVIVGEEPGNVLVIRLDPEYAIGSDASCETAGKLIYEICREGYNVRVTNWTITEVIGIEKAFWLARGY